MHVRQQVKCRIDQRVTPFADIVDTAETDRELAELQLRRRFVEPEAGEIDSGLLQRPGRAGIDDSKQPLDIGVIGRPAQRRGQPPA